MALSARDSQCWQPKQKDSVWSSSVCGRGEEWQLALASGRMPGCERRLVRYGVSISACGRGEEWQLELASGHMPGCVSRVSCLVTYLCGMILDLCHDICWSIAYLCGVLSVVVEHGTLALDCIVFVVVCGAIVVFDLIVITLGYW